MRTRLRRQRRRQVQRSGLAGFEEGAHGGKVERVCNGASAQSDVDRFPALGCFRYGCENILLNLFSAFETIAAVLVMAKSATTMSQTVQLTVPMPANLARLRFPKALGERLHFLLDEQGRKGRLTPAEKKEAEGLAEMASVLSILKLGAQVKAAKSQGCGCSRQTSTAGGGSRGKPL